MKQLMISEEYVKNNSTIPLNVDPQVLRIAIYNAQSITLLEKIGTHIYNKLISLLPTNINLPENAIWKTLMDDYVVPALLCYTLDEVIPLIRYKISNKSVSLHSSDNSTPIDFDEFKYIRSEIKNQAEFKTNRLLKFLKSNTDIYPEFIETTDADELKPSRIQYFNGMFLE